MKPSVPEATPEVSLRKATVKMEKLVRERNRAVKLGRVLAKMALEVLDLVLSVVVNVFCFCFSSSSLFS